MDKYKGIDCPICGKPLDNGEVIAICPDCGAPYHRECILKEGKCIYQDLHEQGKLWENPKQKYEEHTQNMESRRCSRCGTLNDPSCIFCEVCGTILNNTEEDKNTSNNDTGWKTQSNIPPNFMEYNPYNNPFGGIDPDDEIDEIPVKDWAIYIGQNTSYFIPKFKKMSLGEKVVSFNLSSAIFGGFYYLYRKMYLWGAILLIINLMMSLPSWFVRLGTLLLQVQPDLDYAKVFTSNSMIMVANICSILNLVLVLATGLLTNKLYRVHCRNNINKLKKLDLSREQYVEKLNQKGSICKKLIPILLIGYLAISLIASMILVFGIV